MQRGLVSGTYIAGGVLLGVGGLLVAGFALIPALGAALFTIGTNGAFLLMIDPVEFFGLVVIPLLVALLGAGIGTGGLALLLQGLATALGNAPTARRQKG